MLTEIRARRADMMRAIDNSNSLQALVKASVQEALKKIEGTQCPRVQLGYLFLGEINAETWFQGWGSLKN
jgi:hypothetical protein